MIYLVRYADEEDPGDAVQIEAESRHRAAIRFARQREALNAETFELIVADADGQHFFTVDVQRVTNYYAHGGDAC